jgi:hypothetical protein
MSAVGRGHSKDNEPTEPQTRPTVWEVMASLPCEGYELHCGSIVNPCSPGRASQKFPSNPLNLIIAILMEYIENELMWNDPILCEFMPPKEMAKTMSYSDVHLHWQNTMWAKKASETTYVHMYDAFRTLWFFISPHKIHPQTRSPPNIAHRLLMQTRTTRIPGAKVKSKTWPAYVDPYLLEIDKKMLNVDPERWELCTAASGLEWIRLEGPPPQGWKELGDCHLISARIQDSFTIQPDEFSKCCELCSDLRKVTVYHYIRSTLLKKWIQTKEVNKVQEDWTNLANSMQEAEPDLFNFFQKAKRGEAQQVVLTQALAASMLQLQARTNLCNSWNTVYIELELPTVESESPRVIFIPEPPGFFSPAKVQQPHGIDLGCVRTGNILATARVLKNKLLEHMDSSPYSPFNEEILIQSADAQIPVGHQKDQLKAISFLKCVTPKEISQHVRSKLPHALEKTLTFKPRILESRTTEEEPSGSSGIYFSTGWKSKSPTALQALLICVLKCLENGEILLPAKEEAGKIFPYFDPDSFCSHPLSQHSNLKETHGVPCAATYFRQISRDSNTGCTANSHDSQGSPIQGDLREQLTSQYDFSQGAMLELTSSEHTFKLKLDILYLQEWLKVQVADCSNKLRCLIPNLCTAGTDTCRSPSQGHAVSLDLQKYVEVLYRFLNVPSKRGDAEETAGEGQAKDVLEDQSPNTKTSLETASPSNSSEETGTATFQASPVEFIVSNQSLSTVPPSFCHDLKNAQCNKSEESCLDDIVGHAITQFLTDPTDFLRNHPETGVFLKADPGYGMAGATVMLALDVWNLQQKTEGVLGCIPSEVPRLWTYATPMSPNVTASSTSGGVDAQNREGCCDVAFFGFSQEYDNIAQDASLPCFVGVPSLFGMGPTTSDFSTWKRVPNADVKKPDIEGYAHSVFAIENWENHIRELFEQMRNTQDICLTQVWAATDRKGPCTGCLSRKCRSPSCARLSTLSQPSVLQAILCNLANARESSVVNALRGLTLPMLTHDSVAACWSEDSFKLFLMLLCDDGFQVVLFAFGSFLSCSQINYPNPPQMGDILQVLDKEACKEMSSDSWSDVSTDAHQLLPLLMRFLSSWLSKGQDQAKKFVLVIFSGKSPCITVLQPASMSKLDDDLNRYILVSQHGVSQSFDCVLNCAFMDSDETRWITQGAQPYAHLPLWIAQKLKDKQVNTQTYTDVPLSCQCSSNHHEFILDEQFFQEKFGTIVVSEHNTRRWNKTVKPILSAMKQSTKSGKEISKTYTGIANHMRTTTGKRKRVDHAGQSSKS